MNAIKNQETEGLLSPLLRSARLRMAASLIPPNSVVLDMACGGGFLKSHLPTGSRYFGVDRIVPPETGHFDGFLVADVMAADFAFKLKTWLPVSPDVIVMLAFVEHLKTPEAILRSLVDVLAANGRIILTTPHPVGRSLHDWLSRIGFCSASAAAEHECFFDKSDLEAIAYKAGYSVLSYQRFLLGLNQIMEIRCPHVSETQLAK
jgi:SAM-dependent methyltransferase